MSFSFQEKIEAINQAIANEYEVRRKLLVKRLDVTVQSFGWSDRAKVQLAFCKQSLCMPRALLPVVQTSCLCSREQRNPIC